MISQSWYEHVMRRFEEKVVRKVLGMKDKRGKKVRIRGMARVKEDMARKGVNSEMTSNRLESKDKIYYTDLIKLEKGRQMVLVIVLKKRSDLIFLVSDYKSS